MAARAYRIAARLCATSEVFSCDAINSAAFVNNPRYYNNISVLRNNFSNFFRPPPGRFEAKRLLGWWPDSECPNIIDPQPFFRQQTPRVIALYLMAYLAEDGQLNLKELK